jgi:hypothetical protein
MVHIHLTNIGFGKLGHRIWRIQIHVKSADGFVGFLNTKSGESIYTPDLQRDMFEDSPI